MFEIDGTQKKFSHKIAYKYLWKQSNSFVKNENPLFKHTNSIRHLLASLACLCIIYFVIYFEWDKVTPIHMTEFE